MTAKPKPEVTKPEKFDLKKLQAVSQKVIRDNKKWLKEMADK